MPGVSTGDQDVAGQTLRLTQAGAIKVFTDVRSGRAMIWPGLDALLAYARAGDTLAVVRLDRLGRSLAELLATVTMLKERGIALLSLEEKIDTSSAAGELVRHYTWTPLKQCPCQTVAKARMQPRTSIPKCVFCSVFQKP